MKLKEYLKTAENKKTITLMHQKHKYQMHIAKDTLTEKLRGDIAAMPIYMAKGGDSDPDADYEQNLEDQEALLPTNQPVQPPISPLPGTAAPTEIALTPEQKAYNDAIVAEGQQSNMPRGRFATPTVDQTKLFGPNGEAPQNFDTNVAAQVDANQKAQAENQTDALQDQHDKAVAENQTRAKFGAPPVPVPDVPGQGPTPPTSGFQQPPLSNSDISGQPASFNPMMAGYGQMANAYTGAMKNMQQGIAGEANAAGEMGRQQALAAQANIQAQMDIQKQHQDNLNNIQKNMSDTLDDIKAGHINPNHYMENMSTGQKVATAISLALGGFGAAMTHTQNYAAEYLQNQINRDVDSQKANLGTKETLYSAYLKQYGNERDAMDMAKLTQNAIYANQLQEIAGKNADPMAQARAKQLLAAQQMQMAPIMQNMAMRQTMMQNMGSMSPEMVIKFMAPEKEQAGLFKDYQDLQNTARARDNVMSNFDQMNQVIKGTNWKNPIEANQSIQKLHAIRDPMIAGLSKETAGRYTESDAEALGATTPYFPDSIHDLGGMAKMITRNGDDMRTTATKRAQADRLTAQKMNFPSLKPYGIDASRVSRYAPNAPQKTFTAGAPKPPGPNG